MHAVLLHQRGAAEPALEPPGAGAQAGADVSEGKVGGGGLGRAAGQRAVGRGLAPVLVAAIVEVEQDRRRHDGDHRLAQPEAAPAPRQPGHDPAGGVETEGRAAAEDDGVHPLHRGRGI